MTSGLADPALGSAPGWPLVLYFHHVHPAVDHYTALAPDAFRRGLETVLNLVGPAVEPADVLPGYRPPDRPSVLITFDDGYRDNLENAAPLLAEFDVRVLLFCVTGNIDTADGLAPAQRAALKPRQAFMTWAEAGHLASMGHVISAHTATHPHLTELPPDQAAEEVVASLRRVTDQTGSEARTFAYPYGLIPEPPPVPSDVLGFGTVKSAPGSWADHPLRIRRTYLPADAPELWPHLAQGWREQWFG